MYMYPVAKIYTVWCRHQPWVVVLFVIVICYSTLVNKVSNYGNIKQRSHYLGLVNKAHYNMTSSSPRKRQQVLLITHGRSGSSFTSELIRVNPGVFFFFEPLKKLGRMFDSRGNQTRRYGFNVWGDERFEESFRLMESFYRCQPTNITILNARQFLYRNDTMQFMSCLENQTLSGWDYIQCYIDMMNDCKARPMTFAKTIRFRMTWTEQLLQRNPDFKIIFLIRDPRAVLYSQSVHFKNWFDWKSQSDEVSLKFCRSLSEDLQSFQLLQKNYPLNVKLFRYEDGAMHPHSYTRDLYDFLGLQYTDSIHQHVTSLTSPGHTKGNNIDKYTVHKDNPVRAMDGWRHGVDVGFVTTVDRHCGSLYSSLGYRHIDSDAHLRNLSMSLIQQPLYM